MPGLTEQSYGNTPARKNRWSIPVLFHNLKLTRYSFALVIVFLTLSPASAADFGVCCMKAAREQFGTIDQVPWAVCGVDPAFDFTKDTPLGSVTATLGWCKKHCGGFQGSSTSQWLNPLVTWVIPAFTLLILCSIGEEKKEKKKNEPFSGVRYWIQEYLAIIGDPVSAMSGGFAELWVDAWLARKIAIKREDVEKEDVKEEEDKLAFKETMVGLAMIAIQTEFIGVSIFDSTMSGEKRKEDVGNNHRLEAPIPQQEIPSLSIELVDAKKSGAVSTTSNNHSTLTLKHRITTVLKSRIDFVNGITLPVVLVLATTASVFYSAYQTLGDNDTAHGLAFGVWYAWVIVLAVVSNSAVASVNPGVAAAAVGDLLELSPQTVPLRRRTRNTKAWQDWVVGILDEEELSGSLQFFLRYFLGLLLAWVVVAFFCACATAISYNTPTVGIGCRSFSFILYASLSAVTALLLMLRDWNDRDEYIRGADGWKAKAETETQFSKHLRWIYSCLVGFNALVLILSTLAQLIGLYRSCVCNHFGPSTSLLELATGTAQSVNLARRTWIPVGFVAYTFVWLVCGIVVGFRTYISSHIKKFLYE